MRNAPRRPHPDSTKGRPPAKKMQAPAPAAAPDSPEGRLNARGLRRSGIAFVVRGEAKAIEKAEAIRPLIDKMVRSAGSLAQVLQDEGDLVEAQERFDRLRIRADDLAAYLKQIPTGNRANIMQKREYEETGAVRGEIDIAREAAETDVATLRGRQVSAERKRSLSEDFTASRTECLKAASELRQLCDAVKADYDRLQADPDVKKDIAEVQRITKSTATLGPSKQIRSIAETAERIRRDFSPDTPMSKAKAKPRSTSRR